MKIGPQIHSLVTISPMYSYTCWSDNCSLRESSHSRPHSPVHKTHSRMKKLPTTLTFILFMHCTNLFLLSQNMDNERCVANHVWGEGLPQCVHRWIFFNSQMWNHSSSRAHVAFSHDGSAGEPTLLTSHVHHHQHPRSWSDKAGQGQGDLSCSVVLASQTLLWLLVEKTSILPTRHSVSTLLIYSRSYRTLRSWRGTCMRKI